VHADPLLVRHRDAAQLAAATGARLITALADAQAARGRASVVLTGGGTGTALLRAARDSPARDTVDWSLVDVWWGDERFVPAADPDRNDLGADEALLDAVPLDPARVHRMAPSDGVYDRPESAAAAYAAELAERPDPVFDVVLLGVGEDGHVASLFPEQPALGETQRTVVAVHGSPKPPPVRLSLTFPALNAAREVWLVTAGEGKADAVALLFTSHANGTLQVPAAGVRGHERTLWLFDDAAVSRRP
jgi:6-phosphogluconolactonase